jgi:hypothetical protein
MAKKVDPIKQKAKRQKMMAIGGGVLLLALLVFQVPRTMKMLKGPSDTSSSTTPTATTAAGSTPLAPPTLDGGATAGSSGSGGGGGFDSSTDGVRDPSPPVPAQAGQLVSFGRFRSKDPFKEQVKDCGISGCASPASSTSATMSAGSASSSGGASSAAGLASSAGSPAASPPSFTPSPAPAATTASGAGTAAADATTAVISVDGTAEVVSIGKTFPAADPVFVLVALKRGEARISIAGGALASGAPTLRLRLGKKVTLQNTADGTQYVLRLLRIG